MPDNEPANMGQRHELLELLGAAHYQAAKSNGNISSTVATLAYIGSGSMAQAISAAIMTTGELHAPIEDAYYNLMEAGDEYLESLGIIQGFGNSFFKDRIDPAFQPVYDYIAEHYPHYILRIQHIQKVAQIEHLFPNAAIITAMCLSVCDLPASMGIALFIKYRVQAWSELCLEA